MIDIFKYLICLQAEETHKVVRSLLMAQILGERKQVEFEIGEDKCRFSTRTLGIVILEKEILFHANFGGFYSTSKTKIFRPVGFFSMLDGGRLEFYSLRELEKIVDIQDKGLVKKYINIYRWPIEINLMVAAASIETEIVCRFIFEYVDKGNIKDISLKCPEKNERLKFSTIYTVNSIELSLYSSSGKDRDTIYVFDEKNSNDVIGKFKKDGIFEVEDKLLPYFNKAKQLKLINLSSIK